MRFFDIENSLDYYSFGMLMPERFGGGDYRYSFQGQEADNEVKGKGNSVNYKYRMHDARLGRFFAVDPLTSKYPHYTPYSFSGNKVIHAVELEGLEESKFMLKEIFKHTTTELSIPFNFAIVYDHNEEVLKMIFTTGDASTGPISIVYEYDYKTNTTSTGVLPTNPGYENLEKNGTFPIPSSLVTSFKSSIGEVFKELFLAYPEYTESFGITNIDITSKDLSEQFVKLVEEGKLNIGYLPSSPDKIKSVKDGVKGEITNKTFEGKEVYRIESSESYKGYMLLTEESKLEINKLIYIYINQTLKDDKAKE